MIPEAGNLRVLHRANSSALEDAARLADEYHKLKSDLGGKGVWPSLLSKLQPSLPSKSWSPEDLQEVSCVRPGPLDKQAEQYVRWLYPKNQTGFNLFIPANAESKFLGQGVLAWQPQRQCWIKPKRGAQVIDPIDGEVVAAPFGEQVGGMGLMMSPVTGMVKLGSKGPSRRITSVKIAAADWLTPLSLFEIDGVQEVEAILGRHGATKLMATLPLGLRSLVFTGGRSHHGCGIRTRWLSDNIGFVKGILSLIGFDPLTHISTQITRPPGFRRPVKDKAGQSAYQTLIGLYGCQGALDKSSPYQSLPEFVEMLVDWITELKLADEVASLKSRFNAHQPKTGETQLINKRNRVASNRTNSDYREIKVHHRCFEIAMAAIRNGEWRQGYDIPEALLNKISEETALSRPEIVKKFHDCDPHGPAAGTLYGLGLVTQAHEYIGPLKGKHGIISRRYPKRTSEPVLLSEWGHSISVFAQLNFPEPEEIEILHEVINLRKSGNTNEYALKEALRKVCNLRGDSISDWFDEAGLGDPKYARAIELINFHSYDSYLPELADALGQLLERVELCLEPAKGKIHEWIDIDCPARRKEFGGNAQLVSKRKQRDLEALLVPGKPYSFQEMVELAVDGAQFRREYKFSRKWKIQAKELAYSDPTVRQQVRRALEVLVTTKILTRSGQGGRGSFTWALTNGIGLAQAGIQGGKGPEKSLHTKIDRKAVGDDYHRNKPGGISHVVSDVNSRLKAKGESRGVPESVSKKERFNALEKVKRRRPMGLMGYLHHNPQDPGDVQSVVDFGVCRKIRNKKEYRMSKIVLRRKAFKVAVIEARPTFPKHKDLNPNSITTVTGHLIRGLLWLADKDLIDLELQKNEITRGNWVYIKFFVGKKGGLPTLNGSTKDVLLKVTSNYTHLRRLVGQKWETSIEGTLAIKPCQLRDPAGIKLVRDIRATEAVEKMKWTRPLTMARSVKN